MIKLYDFDSLKPEEILNRDIRAEKNVEDVVDAIIADVRTRGDEALKEYALKFDGAEIENLQVTQEEIEALMDRCHALGTKVVGVTLGSRGSIFSEEGKRYHQGIVPVEAIDTMGAGDSFIAGFLTRRILGDGMEDALRFAATAAANTCKFHGGFGYPHPLD